MWKKVNDLDPHDIPICNVKSCMNAVHLIGLNEKLKLSYTDKCSYHNAGSAESTNHKYLEKYGMYRKEYFDNLYMEEYNKSPKQMAEISSYYKELNKTDFSDKVAFIVIYGIGHWDYRNKEYLKDFGMSKEDFDAQKSKSKYSSLTSEQYRELIFKTYNGYSITKRQLINNLHILRFIYNGDENEPITCLRSGAKLENIKVPNYKTGKTTIYPFFGHLHHMKVNKGTSVDKRKKEPSGIINQTEWSLKDWKELLICIPLSRDEHGIIHITDTCLDIEHYLLEHRPWAIRSRENFEHLKLKYNLPDLDYDDIISKLS